MKPKRQITKNANEAGTALQMNTNSTHNPKISVAIISYNNVDFICQAIDSVLSQTLMPFEIVIQDDCSNDNSWKIIQSYVEKNSRLIKAFRHDRNKGIAANFNSALKNCSGEMVTWIAGDDRFLPKKLEMEWSALKGHPDNHIAYSNVHVTDANGKIVDIWDDGKPPTPPSGDIFAQVFTKRLFQGRRSLFRNPLLYRYVIEKVGFFDESLELFEDFDWKIRATHQYKAVYTGEPLVEYRIHDKGAHNSPKSNLYRNIKKVYEKNQYLLNDLPEPVSRKMKDEILTYIDEYQDLQGISCGTGSKNEASHEHLVFLISLPRSGSTLLQRILSGNKDIHTTAEPWLMLHPLHALKKDRIKTSYDHNLAISATRDFLSQIPEQMDLFYQAVRSYGLTFYNRALEVSGKRLFLDKTPRYYSIVPEIRRTFPHARFIILLRNPLAVLSSVLSTWCQNNPALLKSSFNHYDMMDGPKALIQGIEALGDKAITVHYEDLVRNPEACIKLICRDLDIRFDADMLEYGKRKPPQGKFGDTVGIHQNQRPVSGNMNKWISHLSGPTLRDFAREYLYTLGKDTVSQLGYNFSALESMLGTSYEATSRDEGQTKALNSESFLLCDRYQLKEEYDQLIASLNGSKSDHIIQGIARFMTLHPNFPEGHNDLGVIYCNVNENYKALYHYRQAVSHDPGNAVFQKNLADFLFIVEGDIPGALACYNTILANNPKDTEVLYAIGQVSLAVGKKEDAETFFRRVLEIEPGHPDAAQALNTGNSTAPQSVAPAHASKHNPVTHDDANQANPSVESTGSPSEKKNPENAQPDQNSILVATSLAPHAIDIQQKAVQSWIDLGFEVVSLNSSEEIAVLQHHFPQISFHLVGRNSKAHFGKPYIYFDDFLTFFRSLKRSVYGIVNSDIHLKASPEINSFLRKETVESLVYGSRLDIQSLEAPHGDFYRNGFDFFFFDRHLLDIYPESIVSIGVTWWDYWAVLVPALKDFRLKKLISPFGYHLVHDNRWNQKQWEEVGRHIADNLEAMSIEHDESSIPDSAWALFKEIQRNCVAVYKLDKPLNGDGRQQKAVEDLSNLNISLLDFLDRISIKTALPWDDVSQLDQARAKDANFYHNIFENSGDQKVVDVFSRRRQRSARDYIKALKLYRNGTANESREVLQGIVSADPGYPPAENLMAVIAWQLGESDSASRHFNQALQHDPYDRHTVINCANIMHYFGNREEASELYATYLHFNPGDLDMGRRLLGLEGDPGQIQRLEFHLHDANDLRRLPVLIYQMGKVGSTSIFGAIKRYGLPVRHVHTLSWAGIESTEKRLWRNNEQGLPEWMRSYRGLRSHVDRLGNTAHWKIITLVRDPLRRYISELFQNIDRYFPGVTDFDNCDPGMIKSHIQDYLEKFDEQTDHACGWFDRELQAVFGIDVFSVPFDRANGYQHYQGERADVLLIRLENLSASAHGAIQSFLSMDAFDPGRENISHSKPYATLYKRVCSELKVDRRLLDRFYSSRLSRHFYSDEEIESFKALWCDTEVLSVQSTQTERFRVSAVVSTYASEQFIEGRMQNLVDQTLFKKGALEIIVVDSNSPENERAVVERYAARYSQVVYVRTPERETVYAAWNRGIDIARGTYFVNANTDDRFAADALERMADTLDAQSQYDAVYGNWVVTRRPNDTFSSSTPKRLFCYPDFHPELFFYLQISSHANFIRRSVFKHIGGFDGSYTVFGDREFMLRFAANGFKALKLNHTIGLYLENPTSVERANKEIGMKECTALYDLYLTPEKFAALTGHDGHGGHGAGASPKSLADVYTRAGCQGMGLYLVDGKPMHALGSPTRLFARAIELDPGNVEALNNIGVIAQHRGATDDARRFFSNARSIASVDQINVIEVIEKNLGLAAKGVRDPDRLRFLFPRDFQPHRVVETAYGFSGTRIPEDTEQKPKKVGPMIIPEGRHPSLSLCMIVRDEEKYIGRCLESLKPLVDEMIVVDTGSTDATRDIARGLGARVFDFQWSDDFAAARNFSLQQARGDWILIMDADEVIAKKDHWVLCDLLRNTGSDTSKAFMMTTRNYTDRRNSIEWVQNAGQYTEEVSSGWIPSKKVRLFRNHQNIRFVFPVHEQVDPVLVENRIAIVECQVPIHHYGKLDVDRTMERWKMYYTIGKQKLSLMGNDENALKEMAVQAALLGKRREAETYWKKYLDLKPKSLDAHLNLTRLAAEAGDFIKANQYAREACRQIPDRPELLYNLALSQLQTGLPDAAAETAGRMARLFPRDPDGLLLHAMAEIYAGNHSAGMKQLQKLSETGASESLLAQARSIISAIRSAAGYGPAAALSHHISRVDGWHNITGAVSKPPGQKPVDAAEPNDIEDTMLAELYAQANKFYQTEHYNAAVECLNQMLSMDSDYWEAYRLLADVLQQSGEQGQLSERLQSLESRSDLPADVIALIGSGYEALGELSQADRFVEKALAKDNCCAAAWNLKGVIAYRRGKAEEAAAHFQRAADGDAQWGDPWTNLGTIYWEQGAVDQALESLEKGFSLSPVAPNVATAYHAAVSETGQYERARPFFETAVARYPDFLKARYLLIDVLIRLEDYFSALDAIGSVIVRFGADRHLLEAAGQLRAKVGPMTIPEYSQPSLSLCMIVKNEEKYIARCLQSLKPVVDEMIVVDTGSSDATRDIAGVFGAHMFDFKWDNDFAAARNFSLEQARGDWILVMDADEVLSKRDYQRLRGLLGKDGKTQQAFMMTTRNYTGQHNLIGWEPNKGHYPEEEAGMGWIPSEKVRLFPNDKDIRFEFPVHEVVGPSLIRKGIGTHPCPVPVHHYGKLDQNSERRKDEHYYEIGLAKLSASQSDPVAIRELAVQAAKLEKYGDAISLWKRFIALKPNDARAYINLASSHGKLLQYDEARKAAQKAIKLSPKIKEGHLNLGLAELHLGNTLKSETIFMRIVKHKRDYHSAVFLLGACQLIQGKADKGLQTIQLLKNTPLWAAISISIQELAESLMAAGQMLPAGKLIRGAETMGCSNETLKRYERRIEMEANRVRGRQSRPLEVSMPT